VGEAKYSTTGLEQARSANKDHFAVGITFAIANQKCARNKRTINHQIWHCFSGWIIRHRHSRRIHRLRVSVDSLLSTTNYTFFGCFSASLKE